MFCHSVCGRPSGCTLSCLESFQLPLCSLKWDGCARFWDYSRRMDPETDRFHRLCFLRRLRSEPGNPWHSLMSQHLQRYEENKTSWFWNSLQSECVRSEHVGTGRWNTLVLLILIFPSRLYWFVCISAFCLGHHLNGLMDLHTKCCPIALFCMLCGLASAWHHLSSKPLSQVLCWLTLEKVLYWPSSYDLKTG